MRCPDGGVEPHHLTLEVEQRAAAVAAVDRRVGLDEILIFFYALRVTPHRRNDPHGYRVGQAKRAADRKHKLPHENLVGIAHRHHRQAFGIRQLQRSFIIITRKHHYTKSKVFMKHGLRKQKTKA